MARVYSRKKGRSGSKKPMQKTAPWVKLKPDEVEEIIVKLAKKGQSSSQIGLTLRDQYGVPSIRIKELELEKEGDKEDRRRQETPSSSGRLQSSERIAKIMKRHKAYPPFPEDMFNLLKKAVDLTAHMEKNKRDYTSKRGLQITESKIRRLAKYYKGQKVLAADWRYDIEKAKLLVK